MSYDNLTAPIAVESKASSGDHIAAPGGTAHMGRRGAGQSDSGHMAGHCTLIASSEAQTNLLYIHTSQEQIQGNTRDLYRLIRVGRTSTTTLIPLVGCVVVTHGQF